MLHCSSVHSVIMCSCMLEKSRWKEWKGQTQAVSCVTCSAAPSPQPELKCVSVHFWNWTLHKAVSRLIKQAVARAHRVLTFFWNTHTYYRVLLPLNAERLWCTPPFSAAQSKLSWTIGMNPLNPNRKYLTLLDPRGRCGRMEGLLLGESRAESAQIWSKINSKKECF